MVVTIASWVPGVLDLSESSTFHWGAGFDPIAAGGLWDENGQSLVDEARTGNSRGETKPGEEKIEGAKRDEPLVFLGIVDDEE